MREKYETLSLAVLRELAKARGFKGITGLKKADLINRMVEEDEKLKEQNVRMESMEKSAEQDMEPDDMKNQTEDVNKAAKVPAEDDLAKAPKDNQKNQMHQQGNADRTGRIQQGNMGQTEYRPADTAENIRIPERVDRQERFERTEQRQDRQNTDRPDMQQGQNMREQRQDRQNTDRPDMQQGQNMREQRQDRQNGSDINAELDSGVTADGILEVMPDGYGFIRCENYLPGEHDVYVSPSQIRRFGLKTGDIVRGNTRIKTQGEKFSALLYITTINGYHPSVVAQRRNFEDLTPVFPNERMRVETNRTTTSMRIVDLVSPIGKGQRGMIVSPPKAGKTTLLKQVAQAVKANNPEVHLIILLIDERPEEVTDIKEAIGGNNVEVIYSTFDELPEHHKRVSEMVIERAKRLVEHKQDVMILLDSITRLARAYNLTVPPSGRTLSGGLDPAALHMPKRFFGAARNMREGGSLTVLATALVDTGSKMDDVIYEEFKGTGNMELVLDRRLSEKRVFPAIDIVKSGTRREDLLLDREEKEAVDIMRKGINGMKTDEAVENILNMFSHTNNNREYIQLVKKRRVL
ncbi:MAG: transcription termination factor Rho [Eubacterium sp.]|nr:transcription termination factor Rho [Eubacterium sp.]MCI8917328.1 transcription termination factor Rho [Eubacterium sp.]